MRRSISISEEYGIWRLETDDGLAVTASTPVSLIDKALLERGIGGTGGATSIAGVLLTKLLRKAGIGEE